jgi:hypothetical protein
MGTMISDLDFLLPPSQNLLKEYLKKLFIGTVNNQKELSLCSKTFPYSKIFLTNFFFFFLVRVENICSLEYTRRMER